MKKLKIILSVLFLFALSSQCFATRYIYQEVVQDGKGNVVANAEVTVYLSGGTTKATIYTAVTGGAADADSVIETGSDGTYTFYVDEDDYPHNQQFKTVMSKSGYTADTWDYLQIFPDNNRTLITDSTADQGDSAVVGTLAWHISDVSGAATTVKILAGTHTISQNVTVPATMTLRFERGGILADDGSNANLIINGHIEAGFYQIFDWGNGSGSVTWGSPQPLNQLWFGTGDAALVQALAALGDGDLWYLPAGTYTQTTKMEIPNGVRMYGDGMRKTLINSAVSGDVAIELVDNGYAYYKTELSDFHLLGDGSSVAGSSGTGGIKTTTAVHVTISRVKSDGFSSGGWNGIGNQTTELRSGFWASGVVGSIYNDCYAEHNDVGFRVDNGAASVNTATTFNDCTARVNRTHAVLWTNTMTTVWNGGTIESNTGAITFKVTNSGSNEYGNTIRGPTHFENNQRVSAADTADTRDISVDGNGSSNFHIEGIMTGANSEYVIELANTRDAVILSSFMNGPIKINATSRSTVIVGGFLAGALDDSGVATKVFAEKMVISDDADLSGATPNIHAISYAKLPAGTVTNLTSGSSGQIVILEGQSGSILNDASNFLLKNGSTYMYVADGSIVTLRKDKTSDKWVLIGHEPSVAAASLINNATQTIDDRKIYYVPDAATTDITTLNGGYEGHDIFLVSEHTAANTTTFKDGTGNMFLAGDFIMGAGDVLHLVRRVSTTKWHEVSRSAN